MADLYCRYRDYQGVLRLEYVLKSTFFAVVSGLERLASP